MWIQGALARGPKTLYPPTPAQFDALLDFFLSAPDARPSPPFPIHATMENVPRWDPSEAFSHFHIFRDRHERRTVEEARSGPPCRGPNARNWPEIRDEIFIAMQDIARERGDPVDEQGVAAAKKRLSEVTPTSPCWRRPRPWRKSW